MTLKQLYHKLDYGTPEYKQYRITYHLPTALALFAGAILFGFLDINDIFAWGGVMMVLLIGVAISLLYFKMKGVMKTK